MYGCVIKSSLFKKTKSTLAIKKITKHKLLAMCLQDVKEENSLILFRRQDMDSKQVDLKDSKN